MATAIGTLLEYLQTSERTITFRAFNAIRKRYRTLAEKLGHSSPQHNTAWIASFRQKKETLNCGICFLIGITDPWREEFKNFLQAHHKKCYEQ